MSDSQKPPWTITPEKVNLVVDRLVETGRPRKIILCGSYVRGETHADSDLDVLVVSDDEVENTRKESVRLRRALRGIPVLGLWPTSNAAAGQVPPRPGGLGRFRFLASFLLSRRALAMLLRRASPESEIASSKTGIYFCTDPKWSVS